MWHLLTHTSGLTYGFHHAHPVDALYRERGFEWGTPPGLDLAACCARVGAAAAALPARHGVELRRLHRRARPRDRGHRRASRSTSSSPRACSARSAWSRPASSRRGRPRPARRALHPRPRDRPRHAQPDVGRGDAAARLPLRRRRARLHRRRLPALHAHAARRRRARRRAPAQPAHAAADDEQPAARRTPTSRQFGRPLFAETTFDGVGFGLGFSVVEDPVAPATRAHAASSRWGGAASTAFWVDPTERMEVLVLHPAAAVEHVSDPLPAAPAGPPGADRLDAGDELRADALQPRRGRAQPVDPLELLRRSAPSASRRRACRARTRASARGGRRPARARR